MELHTSVRKNSGKLHDGAWKRELRTKRSDATAHIRSRVKEGGALWWQEFAVCHFDACIGVSWNGTEGSLQP